MKAAARHGGRAPFPGSGSSAGQAFFRDEPPDEALVRREVDWFVGQGLQAIDRGLVDTLDQAAGSLAERCASVRGQRIVVATLIATLTEATSQAWERGWQPSDVHRLAVRNLTSADQSLLLDVMSHELSRYAPSTVDRRWLAQVRELEGGVWWSTSQTYLDAHRQRGVEWMTLMSRVLAVVHLLLSLPALERLTPLPGTVTPPVAKRAGAAPGESRADARAPVVDERILSRVRQLLAKAESTTFEAEAETFTAGAQALMARHSIDAALLAADRDDQHGDHDAPRGRRIGIDNPYEGPKAMLLDAVAGANGCRMVWSRELGFGTVIGFESDLEGVELLFTSLLVQATRALTSAGSRTDRYGRSRTRSFRQSFLTAFAGRIGERLKEVTFAEVDAAAAGAARTSGRELVPLLAARATEVDDAVETWFPGLRSHSVGTARDAEGWHSGRATANQAQLSMRTAVE